jgi:hypothetical protein
VEELVRAAFLAGTEADDYHWAALHAAAQPTLDGSGGPTLQVRVGDEVTSFGIARCNILNVANGCEFAAGLVKARRREELKSAAAQKTARADAESDLVLLQQLLAPQAKRLATTASFAPCPQRPATNPVSSRASVTSDRNSTGRAVVKS